MRKIVTTCICPPIPVRANDWCAYFDGEEEAGNYGYGATEDEAIADFLAEAVCDGRVTPAESLQLASEAATLLKPAATVGPDPSHTDFELMLRAWHSGPAGRDVALQMADLDRTRAGVAK